MKTLHIYLISAIISLSSCSEDSPGIDGGSGNNQNNSDWLIPRNEVRDGGPGKDGIPALTTPELIPAEQATWLTGNELVLGFADGEEVRAYPHQILDWHEIINDNTANHSISVIYCPLTGTGIGWDRIIDNRETTFGVSGLLYNTNIIPYDRATDSNWSQLLLKSVNGSLSGTQAKTYHLLETTWETWKTMYPSSKVVSRNTGHSRSYGRYPYGDYKVNEGLIFPVSNNDNRLHAKKRVLSIIVDEKAKAYQFEKLTEHNNLILDIFQETKIVVAGSTGANLMVAFKQKLSDGTELNFQAVENQLPVILTDNEGNTWDVFGRAVNGPRKGQKLETIPQMMGYWFSFAAFYPEIELF